MDPMTRRKAMMMLAASSGGGGAGILPVEWENSKLKFSADQAETIQGGQMFSFSADGVVLIGYVSKFPYSDSYQSAGEVLFAYGENLYRGCLVFDSETTAYFNAAPNGVTPANPGSMEAITLPPVDSSDNGKVLGVDNGQWGAMDAIAVVTMDETTWTFSYTDEQFDLIQKYGRFVMKTINEDVPVYVIGTLYEYGNYYVSPHIALFRNNPVAICTGKLKLEKSPKRGSFLDSSNTQAYFGNLDRITVPVPGDGNVGQVLMVHNASGVPHFSWKPYYPAKTELMDEQSAQLLQSVLTSLSASAATSGSASAYMPQDNSALLSLLATVVLIELKHFMIQAGSYVFSIESFTLDSLGDNIETATFICSYIDATNDFLHFTARLAVTASYTALIVDCKTVPLISM